MLIVVIAGGEDQKEFQDKELPEGAQVQFVTTIEEAKPGAEGYFYLLNETDLSNDFEKIKSLGSPVFIKPLSINTSQLPENVVKFGQWPGFLFKETMKVTVNVKNIEAVTKVLNHLKWDFEPVIITDSSI